MKIYRRPWELTANQHWPCCQGGQHGRCMLGGKSHGRQWIFKILSFLYWFSIILSDFVMLNFVAICKGISTTPSTSINLIFFIAVLPETNSIFSCLYVIIANPSGNYYLSFQWIFILSMVSLTLACG